MIKNFDVILKTVATRIKCGVIQEINSVVDS